MKRYLAIYLFLLLVFSVVLVEGTGEETGAWAGTRHRARTGTRSETRSETRPEKRHKTQPGEEPDEREPEVIITTHFFDPALVQSATHEQGTRDNPYEISIRFESGSGQSLEDILRIYLKEGNTNIPKSGSYYVRLTAHNVLFYASWSGNDVALTQQ